LSNIWQGLCLPGHEKEIAQEDREEELKSEEKGKSFVYPVFSNEEDVSEYL
jgi:hypothetical protein